MTGQTQRLLNVGQVASILGISVSGVWAKASSDDGFPKPFKLSAKQTRWSSKELDEFILAKMESRPHSIH